ncbi:hypothetical protein SUGI_1116640 [Cryptomeria japonica]|nr:hypothetical protein SUGI_1116640 [Cryptomeria japonica]
MVCNVEQARNAESAGAIAMVAAKETPMQPRAEATAIWVNTMIDPGVDFIDESEILSPADDQNCIHKHNFWCPFVCSCKDLGRTLRKVAEVLALVMTKDDSGCLSGVERILLKKLMVGVTHCVVHVAIGRLVTSSHEPVFLFVSGGNT